MNGRKVALAVLMGALMGLWCTGTAEAQLGGLKKKIEKKVENKADKEADKKIDEALEGKPAEPEQSGESQSTSGGEATSSGKIAAGDKPGAGPWLNYDFVPGSRVLFFEDFSKDVVGNFPQRLEFETGNMEIAEWNDIRWLRSSTASRFSIALPEVLPEKFTIEFDMYTGSAGWNSVGINGEDSRRSSGHGNTEQAQVFYEVTNRVAGLRNLLATTHIAMGKVEEGVFSEIMHCRVLADGAYMKVYVNEKRVANVPKANFIRTNKLFFDVAANDTRPLMLANFRVAASDKTIYDALIADGQVTTQGILFDFGSDKIRPESTPTLKEIGKMLADHADLRLMIEGHTDNVGDDASNMSLSERRAASVKSHLVANYSIDAGRLESKGFGESKPAAGNDTAEGRQNNRRVVLVKL